MTNRPCEQGRQSHDTPAKPAGTRAFPEPEIRRWPHPVKPSDPARQPAAARQSDAALYYIHCALSYQNQLLADIKTLLEQMTVDSAQIPEEK